MYFPPFASRWMVLVHPDLGKSNCTSIWEGSLERLCSRSRPCTFQGLQHLRRESRDTAPCRCQSTGSVYFYYIKCSRTSRRNTREPVSSSTALAKAGHWGVKGDQGARTAGDNYLQSKDLRKSNRTAGWGVLPGWIIGVIWTEATGLKH